MSGLEPAPGPRPAISALASPLAVVTAAAGGAVALVADLPALVAVAAGALAYAAGAGLSALRRRGPRRERIDPFVVGERWRPFVKAALQAQARYADTVATVAPGPLRQRLEDIGRRIDRGVEECWRVAQRGHAIDAAVSTLQVSRRQHPPADPGQGEAAEGPSGEPLARSLEARLSAAERLEAVAGEARQRLQLLEARLDEAVATAVELAVQAGQPADTGRLGSDVDDLVDELEALRSALDDM